MNSENVGKPNKKVQITAVIIVGALLLAVCGYCFYTIYTIKQTNVEQLAFQEKVIRESDGTWGVAPNEACTVYQDIGLMGLDYKMHDPQLKKFGCHSPIVDMPSKNGKKTLQYLVSGYPEKATHFSLVLSINDDINSVESLAARKSWAIYAAVLYTKLFGQTVGEFTESQMQELVDLTEKSNVSYYKDGKLLITADVKVKEGIGTYTFNIDGLPNLKF